MFGHALPMPVVVQTPEATNDSSGRGALRVRLGLPEHDEASPAAALFGAPDREPQSPQA